MLAGNVQSSDVFVFVVFHKGSRVFVYYTDLLYVAAIGFSCLIVVHRRRIVLLWYIFCDIFTLVLLAVLVDHFLIFDVLAIRRMSCLRIIFQ